MSYQNIVTPIAADGRLHLAPDSSTIDFDERILAEFFKVVEAPPLEMLKTALEQTRSHERSRLNWIESERERLAYEERRAQERAERTHDSLPRVSQDALQKLNKVLTEKDEFEQKIALEQSVPKTDESEEELEELCKLASDVPALWHNPLVTHKERKEILRTVDRSHRRSGNQRNESMLRFFGNLAAKRPSLFGTMSAGIT